jgi:hypothetical protein
MDKPWRVYQIGDQNNNPIYMITDGRDQFVGGEHDKEWRLVGRIGDKPQAIRQMVCDSNLDPIADIKGHGFTTFTHKHVWSHWKPSM